jgi:uncharacterized membrane protein YhaH (DUF805 family)
MEDDGGAFQEPSSAHAESTPPGSGAPRTAHGGIWSLQGRIGRSSFWHTFIGLLVFGLFGGILIGGVELMGKENKTVPLVIFIYVLWSVVSLWLTLAIQVKRLHDLDRSGWWVLLNFTYIAIPLILIILGSVRGSENPNKYNRYACDECLSTFPLSKLKESAGGQYVCNDCRDFSNRYGAALA